ncbi:MAG: Ig-like domain-containing protein [Planctomycetaceae bacterium]
MNDAPTISAVADQTLAEDTTTGALAFTVADTETAAGALSVTATSSDQTLLPDGNLTLVDLGSGNWTVEAAPAANQFGGPVTITLTVDDGTTTTQTTFDVTVNPVNDAPTITSNGGLNSANISVTENYLFVTTITSFDYDGGQPIYSILALGDGGGPDASQFIIDQLTGKLSFVAAPNFELPGDANGDNLYEVTVVVSDGSGGFDRQSVMVAVVDENETPVGADDEYSVNQVTTLNVELPGVTSNDLDPDGDPLSVILGSDVANGTLLLNPDGTFSYTPNGVFFGVDSFTYVLTDGVFTSDVVTVTITTLKTINPVTGPDDTTTTDDAPDDPAANDEDNPEIAIHLPISQAPDDSSISPNRRAVAPVGTQLIPIVVAVETALPGISELSPESFVLSYLRKGIPDAPEEYPRALAPVVEVTQISLTPLSVMPRDLQSAPAVNFDEMVAGTIAITSSVLSAGYVIWLLRSGMLAVGIMASVPTWCRFDPLAVITSDGEFEDDDESLASIAKNESGESKDSRQPKSSDT